jgi:hypothetical protein
MELAGAVPSDEETGGADTALLEATTSEGEQVVAPQVADVSSSLTPPSPDAGEATASTTPPSKSSTEQAATTSTPLSAAPYRRQSMMQLGSSTRANSWRAKNKAAEAIFEEPRPHTADGGDDGANINGTDTDGLAANAKDNDDMSSGKELTFWLPELIKDGEEASGKMVKETWPLDHVKLLYMLSKYATCALKQKQKEAWIRQIPLLVLMYEGIAAGALDFDYAPAAMVIAQEGRPKRIWMNTTQDGKSAIDDLREANHINGLKLSTKDYHSVTAFQVSERGLELLKQTSKELRADVDAFIYAPKPYRHELLKIRYIPIQDPPNMTATSDLPFDPSVPSWAFHASDKQLSASPALLATTDGAEAADAEPEFNEEGRFVLESIGYYRYSEVTETEDVSYVSSPFVPQCVRSSDAYQQLSSNADRADEAASGQSNIRDELSEAIVLMNPVCMVGEWIPFGSNQIVALNERLGSMDRCQGGLFTSLIDDRPTDTLFEVPPGLTQVRILDYDPVRFINFEAEINFPEDDGIVQVENFGIHLNVDGTIFYGIRVDAILDKKSERISVDLLSRLLVDIHQDSSEIMDDLLSSYQTSLLDMVFLGDIANRGKFNMIMADQIEPFMPGVEYMDRGDYENELKQVLGDIHCAYDIGDDSVMIVGRDGMLIAGSAATKFEKVFIAYFSLLCREMFLRSFFTRIFVLEELLKHTRQLLFSAKEDPNHVVTIRTQLNRATNDLILFTDTLGYLLESLEFVKIPHKSANASLEEEEIYSYLDLKKQHHDILLRARDLEKLVHGAKYEVVNLRQMAEVLNTSQLEDIFKTVEANTKVLADASIGVKQSGASLDLVQILLAASFALAILDRIPGGTLNIESPQWVLDAFLSTIIDVPFLFFTLSLLWIAACVAVLLKYKQAKHRRDEIGRRTLRLKVNRPFKVDRFEAFLATRDLAHQESVCQAATELRRVMWRDVKDMRVTSGVKNTQGVNALTKNPQTLKHKLILWWRRTKHRLWAMYGGGGVGNAVAPRGPHEEEGDDDDEEMVDSDSLAATLEQPRLPIQVEVEYDSRHSFLLFVTIYFHVPDTHTPVSPPLWRRAVRWLKKKISQAKRWYRRQRLPPGSPTKRGNLTETMTSSRVEQSTKRSLQAAAGKKQEGEAVGLAEMSRPERELLMWFAWTLKNHKVIDKIEHLLGATATK